MGRPQIGRHLTIHLSYGMGVILKHHGHETASLQFHLFIAELAQGCWPRCLDSVYKNAYCAEWLHDRSYFYTAVMLLYTDCLSNGLARFFKYPLVFDCFFVISPL